MRPSGRLALSIFSLLTLCWPGAAALAGQVDVRAGGSGYRVNVTSLEEQRFATVVRQQHDFSCGSAALATLLTFHYDVDTPEDEVFDAMYAVGDQKSIREVGFSMLDMK